MYAGDKTEISENLTESTFYLILKKDHREKKNSDKFN